MTLFSKWKNLNELWAAIKPFVENLVKQQVPKTITLLYENLAKYTQPTIDSLFKLKAKIKETPNELDNYCFNQGVSALETFANSLLGFVEKLRA